MGSGFFGQLIDDRPVEVLVVDRFLFVNASLIFNSGNSCSSSFSRVANFRLCIAFSSNSLLKGMISAPTVAPA